MNTTNARSDSTKVPDSFDRSAPPITMCPHAGDSSSHFQPLRSPDRRTNLRGRHLANTYVPSSRQLHRSAARDNLAFNTPHQHPLHCHPESSDQAKRPPTISMDYAVNRHPEWSVKGKVPRSAFSHTHIFSVISAAAPERSRAISRSLASTPRTPGNGGSVRRCRPRTVSFDCAQDDRNGASGRDTGTRQMPLHYSLSG